jgi:hypothetical protein
MGRPPAPAGVGPRERPSERAGVQPEDAGRPSGCVPLRPCRAVKRPAEQRQPRWAFSRRGGRDKSPRPDRARHANRHRPIGVPCVRPESPASWKVSRLPRCGNGEPTGGVAERRHLPGRASARECQSEAPAARRGFPWRRRRGNPSECRQPSGRAGRRVQKRGRRRSRPAAAWLRGVRAEAGRPSAVCRVEGPAGAEPGRPRGERREISRPAGIDPASRYRPRAKPAST